MSLTTAGKDVLTEEPSQFARRMFWAAAISIALTLAMELFFQFGNWWAVNHLPPGDAFVLTPRGAAWRADLRAFLCLFGGIGTLYTLCASVTHSITSYLVHVVSICMFLVLPPIVRANTFIAVVRTPDTVVLVWPFPFSSITLPNDKHLVAITDGARDRQLLVIHGVTSAHSVWVHRDDQEANRTLNDVVRALRPNQ